MTDNPHQHTKQPPRRLRRVVAAAVLMAACVWSPGCETDTTQTVDPVQAEQLLRQGRAYAEQGLTAEALALFETALEHNPNLTEAHLQIGHIHRNEGDHWRASRSYEHATKTDPNSFDAHYYLGLMRQMTGRLRDAVTAYLRAIAIRPDDFAAHQNLAGAYVQLKQPDQALPYAQKATSLDPEHQGAWANLGATHSLLGQYSKAVDAYREAIELGEMAEPILLGLANAHLRLGHLEQSRVVLESLISQSNASTPHERMGLVLFKMRRFNDALASYESALRIDPDDTAALNGKGVCLMTRYLRSGRGDRRDAEFALGAWRRSLRLRPAQPRIVSLLTRYQGL